MMAVKRRRVARKLSRLAMPEDNDFEYRLLNVERPESRTHEVEAMINDLAEEGWKVVGYSAQGWRGVAQAGFSHLVLFERPHLEDEEDEDEATNG